MSQFTSAHALENAGLTREVAEALVVHVEKIVDARVATKADLIDLRSELRLDISKLRDDMRLDVQKLTDKISNVQVSLMGWIIIAMVINGAIGWAIKHFG